MVFPFAMCDVKALVPYNCQVRWPSLYALEREIIAPYVSVNGPQMEALILHFSS